MTDRYKPHDIEWTPERVSRIWEYYGTNPAFDDTYFSMQYGRSVLQFVQSRVSLAGREVLDFGAGRGHMLKHLLAEGLSCRGVEFSEESAALTEKELRHNPRFHGIVRAQDIPTPVPDSSVDAVFIIEVIEHLFEDKLAPTLAEIFRILRPGGYIIATTPHDENLIDGTVHCPECGARFHRWQHLRKVTVTSMSDMMETAGFREKVCEAAAFKPNKGRIEGLLIDLRRWLYFLRGKTPSQPNLIYIGEKP